MPRVLGIAIVLGCFAGNVMLHAADPNEVVLIIHGGTAPARARLSAEREQAMRAVMAEALQAGRAALEREGADPLDGVAAAIVVLEDSPLFNAGRGAVFTADERIELDASIMSGRDRRAGAVAGVRTVKNPIRAARAVMEKSPHVLLIGEGAERFCQGVGLEIVDPAYFRTEERLQELRRLKTAEEQGGASLREDAESREWSTVGAVALGADGRITAGTSTGGMVNKRHGRVGDSPIIGAGTYADDRACGVSCTGHGEYFIRFGVARSIVERVRREKQSIEQAAREVIHDDLGPAGGTGGVIVLDRRGHATFAWNTPGMWHGRLTRDGKMFVEVYEE